MIVDSAVYRDGTRVPVDCDVADLAALRESSEAGEKHERTGAHSRAKN